MQVNKNNGSAFKASKYMLKVILDLGSLDQNNKFRLTSATTVTYIYKCRAHTGRKSAPTTTFAHNTERIDSAAYINTIDIGNIDRELVIFEYFPSIY